MTTTRDFAASAGDPPRWTRWVVVATIVWQLLVAIASTLVAVRVFGMDQLTILGQPADLGRPVQNFVAFAALIPAAIGLASAGLFAAGRKSGRYLALVLNAGGAALALLALLGAWGAYGIFERIVDAIMANAPLTLGFALAYLLFYLGGRLDEESVARRRLVRGAGFVAAATLAALLIAAQAWRALGALSATYRDPQTWLLTGATIVFFGLTWLLIRVGAVRGETPDEREAWQGWLMLGPNIVGFLLFFAGPLLLSFYLSFTNASVGQVPEVVWFENYAELLAVQVITLDDPAANAQSALAFGYAVVGEISIGGTRIVLGAKDRLFWISLRNTLLFCLMLLPLAIAPALGLALILNSSLPGMRFFRAIYFLPSVAAVVGTALIWRWLYTPTTGFIDYTIANVAGFFGLPDPQIEWLSDPSVVLISIVLLAAWQVVGYNTVLFLAGLQGVPKSLYEAASIDGANPWQKLRNVTLPMVAPTTFFVVITTMVTGLQVFNEPYALFPSRPPPENATTMVYYLYQSGFNQFTFGYASAIAWVLFLIIFTLTFIQFRLNRQSAAA